jgi:hypothetical protein
MRVSEAMIALVLVVSACVPEASGAAPERLLEGSPAASEAGTAAPKIAGRYQYVGGERERQALDSAIDDVVKEMMFLARPIARRRLRDSNQPSNELYLEVSATQITIVRPGRPTVAARRDGAAVVWTSPEGDEFTVRHRLGADGSLIQEFVGDGNRSLNIFKLASDGSQLSVQTTISADRLPKVLRFQMTYRRVP